MSIPEKGKISTIKMNIISKINQKFSNNIMLYENNLLIFSQNLTLYSLKTFEIISKLEFPERIYANKIEITPQNTILILSGTTLSSWQLDLNNNKLKHLFSIKNVYSFTQNKIKNEIILLIKSKFLCKLDYLGKILFSQIENLLIEYEYKIKKKSNENDDINIDEDSFNELEHITIVFESFNNYNHIFYLNGFSFSSDDPYEPYEYNENYITIYNIDNLEKIYDSNFETNSAYCFKKLSEKYFCDENTIYYFDFNKKEIIENYLLDKMYDILYLNKNNFLFYTQEKSLFIVDSNSLEIREKIDIKLAENEKLESLILYNNDNIKNIKFIGKIFSFHPYSNNIIIGELI